jgi:hypothetical protein
MKLFAKTIAATFAAGLLLSGPALASDHADSPALGEGDGMLGAGADINDLYAFADPADATRTVGILTVGGIASAADAEFSDAVSYSVLYLPVQGTDVVGAPLGVSCAFSATEAGQGFSCWIGDPGNSMASGLVGSTVTSDDGKLKVWTGLKDDPFFFDLAGFNATVAAFAPSFTDPPTDGLAGANTLAIVFSVDSDSVNSSTLTASEDDNTTVLGAFGLTKRLPIDLGGEGEGEGEGGM